MGASVHLRFYQTAVACGSIALASDRVNNAVL
jgi:hypothetical protein